MEKLSQLRAQRGTIIDELNELAAGDDKAAYDTKRAELTKIDEKIERVRESHEIARTLAQPVDPSAANHDPVAQAVRLASDGREDRRSWGFAEYLRAARQANNFTPSNEAHFQSFGEMLRAVVRQCSGSGSDSRLVRAPAGAGETDGSAGGFLVQSDFASTIWMRAYDMGEMLSRVFKLPISAKSNGIKIPAIDETSRATGSRWGGVQSYWLGEGDSANPTKPKFRLIELDLKKLMSTMYTSDELLEDAEALQTVAFQAFSEEIMFMTEDGIFEGDGVGKPLGVMNSPALVTVAKDNGQATGTISGNNVSTMWSRCWNRSRKNAVWFINQDCEPQLMQLNQPIGTAGGLLYLPPGGWSQEPYGTLFGRPVIATEYNSSLSTAGDIMLADLSQYVLADKRGIQAATSMHVRFLTDEMVFRITYRVDGQPLWHAPLTPFKGSNTKSPFIVLASR